MADSKKKGPNIGSHYGFLTNLRAGRTDIAWYFSWMSKFKIKHSITSKKLAIFLPLSFIIGLSAWLYLKSGLLKVAFMGLPTLMVVTGLMGVLILYTLMDPTKGSLLRMSILFIRSVVNRWVTTFGNPTRDRQSGISFVDKKGNIVMDDGQYGFACIIDGANSPTSFPSEIKRQEEKAKDYHKTRTRTTTIYNITSSQLQDAESNIKEMESRARVNTVPAIKRMCESEAYFEKTEIHNKKPIIIQYKLFTDPRMSGLKESKDHLERFTDKGYINNFRVLTTEEIEEVFGNILKFK